MRLTVSTLIVSVAVAVAVVVAGCTSFHPGASSSPVLTLTPESVVPASEATAVPRQSTPPASIRDDPGDQRAQDSCTATMNSIPMVAVNSGEIALVAAYEVTGAELATYLETMPDSLIDPGESQWRDEPNKVVDVCFFDGDFIMKTPGPPDQDRSAVRILVTISDGRVLPWATAREDPEVLPSTDPGTLPPFSKATPSN